jgi:hypothetical protein
MMGWEMTGGIGVLVENRNLYNIVNYKFHIT